MMRRTFLLVFAAAAVLLCVVPSAFAAAHRTVIFDPGLGSAISAPPSSTCTNDLTQPCQVFDLSTSYLNTWISCTTPGLPTGLSQYQSCLWFQNMSGSAANVFSFGMNVAAPGDAGQLVDCATSPEGIATWICPDSLPGNGDPFTVKFFANPAVGNQDDFIIAINDFDANPGSPVAVASVPEPGALGMFGLGLIAIVGAYGWKRRRDGVRARS